MKQFAKKFTAAMLAAVMAGTAPGTTVFADSIESSLLTNADTDAAENANASDSLITDSNAVSTDSSSESVSSSSSAIAEKKTYKVSASGFVDDKYEMTAEAITDKDILSEIEKLMDGREILAPVEISVSEGTVEDADRGVKVTLHDVDLTDAGNLVLSNTDEIGLYHIEDFTTDSPKVEKLDYERKVEPSTKEDGKEKETITFTTKSFSPFIFAKMTDEEIKAEKEKKEEAKKKEETKQQESAANKAGVANGATDENAGSTSGTSLNSGKETSSAQKAEDAGSASEGKEESVVSTSKATPSEAAESTEKSGEKKEENSGESVETVSSSSNAEKTEKTKKPSLMAKIQKLLKTAAGADSSEARDLNVTDLSLSASVSGGAEKNDQGDFVWTPGTDTDEADHPYIYKVTYKTSGAGFYAPGEFQISIPKSLLKDREGNAADTYEMSIPEETETGLTDDNPLVYREDGDNIIVYNRIEIPAAQNGYVEIAYHTSKKTWEYADYAPNGNGTSKNGGKNPCSDTFTAGFQAGDKTATANAPAVYMDTQAEVTSTEKVKPVMYKTWQSAWGTAPSDADQYYYLVWNVRTYIEANQPYTLTLTDSFDTNTDGSFAGVRYAGESGFTPAHSLTLSESFRSYYRLDSVLTKLKKSTYQPKDYWTVYNTETVKVDPTDKIDAPTQATAKQSYYYEKPLFKNPVGHFYSEKWGLNYKGEFAQDSTDLAVMDDEDDDTKKPVTAFIEGKAPTLGSFRYATYADGYPYPWTLEEGADAGDWQNYGKVPITYSLYDGKIPEIKTTGADGQQTDKYVVSDGNLDGNVFLYDNNKGEKVALTAGTDYYFDGLDLSFTIKDAAYNEDTAEFDEVDGTYTDNDIITLSVLLTGGTDYVTAGTYNLKTGTWTNVDNSIINGTDGTKVTFKGSNVVGMCFQTTNAHYFTMMYMYPSITLNRTDTVWKYANEHPSLMIVRNRSHADMRKYYGTTKEDTIINFDSVGTDYAGKQQHAGWISKGFYSYKNDKKNRILTVKWDVRAGETNLTTLNNISQKSGVFYDLLPLGSTYKADSVSVYADGVKLKDGVYTVEVTDNYKNSGRTLLTVRMGKQAYNYEMLYESIYTYDALKDFGNKMRNSVAYETGNSKLGEGRPDDGGTRTDSSLLKDLDPNTDDEKFIYTETTKTFGIPVAANLGLYKKIKAEKDSNYKVATVTRQDSSYSYKMRFATDDVTTAKDLILYDSMENYKTTDGKTSDWHGILQSIDVSQPESLGIAPVVYYSTVSNPDTSKFGGTLDASLGWSSTKPSDASKITAIAIDCRKDKDGKAYTLPKNTGLSVVVYMKSPKAVTSAKKDPTAYNNIYLYSTVMPDGGTAKSDTIHQDYTSIQYRAMGNLSVHKINSKDNSAIEGIGFTLNGTSDYGTDINMVKTTNADGNITFEDVEKGTYALQETGFLDDYLKDDTQYVVTIDASGKASIKGMTAGADGFYTIKNSPRIHGDLSLVKKGYVDDSKATWRLQNAVFKLYGTSDYGNEVLMYAESNAAGVAPFKNVEKGTYTLIETKASEGYILPKDTKYRVICDNNGNVGVQKAEKVNGKTSYRNVDMDTQGNYILMNEPYHKLTIIKESDYDKSALAGAEFTLTGTSDYGTKVDTKETSGKNGILQFSHLEPGTYVLTETKAPIVNGKTYRLDSTKRAVVIASDGTTTVEGLKDDGQGNFIVYNQQVPTDKIVITKKWKDGLTGDAAANRAYPNIHIASYDKDEKISIPVTTEWKDGGAQTDLTVHLMNGNTKVASASLTSANGYKTAFTNLSKWDSDGNAVNYELTLDNPGMGYQTTVTGSATDGFKVNVEIKYAAYAVLSDSTLYFVQAQEKNYNSTDTYTLVSKSGRSCTGTVYSDVEEERGSYTRPSWSNKNNITKVVVVDKIYPKSCNNMFYGLKNLSTIENISNINTSNVTKMRSMFSGCNALTSLDLSSFNTSNVTDMNGMFDGCSALTSLNLSNFNTSNVTNMGSIFDGCSSLTSLNVSSFNTSNVTSMYRMFTGCASLTSLDVSKFDTSNVTDMSYMFSGCKALTNLTLSSKFDTSKVKSMSDMFSYCSALASLDVSGFNTSKVTNMNSMFFGCSKLTSLDVSNFNTSSVTYMSYMFRECSSLVSLDVSNFDTSNVTDMIQMFYDCNKLTSLDVSNFNTSKVTDMSDMFDGCSKLTNLDVSNFNTSNVTDMSDMFYFCSSLTGLDVSNFDTSNVTNMGYMFYDCRKLTTVYCNSDWNNQKVTSSNNMFYGCDALSGGSSGQVKYDINKIGIEMANPDTGYFTKKSSGAKTAVLTSLKSAAAKSVSLARTTIDKITGVKDVEAATGETKRYTITYEAPGGKFSNGTDTNTVTYKNVHHAATTTEYVHTDNINDAGEATGAYDNNKDYTRTVTIPGAKKLTIDVYYSTENSSFDWLAIYSAGVTPSSSNSQASISGGKLGGGKAYDKAGATHATFMVDGDTAQFYFKSDNSSSYYGYYAVVTDEYDYADTVSGTYEEPKPNNNTQEFKNWFTDSTYQTKIENPSSLKTKATVFAKIADYDYKGTWGTCPWHITKDGILEIGAGTGTDTYGIDTDGKMTDITPWKDHKTDIKSVKATGNVVMPKNCAYMFDNYKALISLDLSNFNTSNVTDMSYMFSDCHSLTSLTLSSKFDTSNVTDMNHMFYYCSSLTSLDLSSFDTINVTDMNNMFYWCSSLMSLDLSNFDTSSVTDMNYMFYKCSGLKSLDLSSFDTSSVTDMNYMFYKCSGLKSLDLSSFDTSNVKDMSDMFHQCSSLTSLNVSSFDTSNVTDMSYMFYDCSALTSLDLLNFNTPKVWGMSYMFSGCSALTSLDVSNFDTSKVWGMSYMFSGCSTLTSLDVSNFNTSNVTVMNSMFYKCSSLTSLDVSNFNTSNVTGINSMFKECGDTKQGIEISGLEKWNIDKLQDMSFAFASCQATTLDLSNWDVSNVQFMWGVFQNADKLQTINLIGWNPKSVRDISSLFQNCKSLKQLDLHDWDVGSETTSSFEPDWWSIFDGCESLKSLNLTGWNVSKITSMSYMFQNCTNLEYLNLSGWETKLTYGYDNFKGCTKLKELKLSSHFSKTATYSSEYFDIPEHKASDGYTEKWTKVYPRNHTDAITTAELNAKYSGDNAKPEDATWYWEKTEDKYAQSEQSDDGVTITKDSSGIETTSVNVYDPQKDDPSKIASFVDPKTNNNPTGYWTKLSDDTWTYTFYVYNANVPWRVWEDEMTGYISSNTEKNPLVLDKDTHDGTITNRSAKYAENNVGTLTLTKRAVDSTGTEITTDEHFRFVITLTQDDGTALSGVTTFGSVPFHDGKATVTMTAGQTITMTKIPAGTRYAITETSIPDGYKQTAFTQSSGTIQAQSKTEAVCTNTKDEPETPGTPETPKTGGFTLTKSCPEDTASAFTFHVSLTGLGKNRTYSYGTTGAFTSDDSGMADVALSLKDGESVTFAGLPIGATYQITEDANTCVASFRVTDANNLGLIATNKKENTEVQTALSTAKESVDDGENVTVAFTNRIKTFPISILKQDPDGGFVTGAVLQIKKGDTVVHEWTTADSEEEEANLAPGEYVLHEKEAPQGFNLAEDIAFIVDNDGTIRMSVKNEKNNVTEQAVPNLVMVDTRSTAKISIRKTDGSSLISGAKLQIMDDAGTVIDEWTSDGTVHETDLALGKTYTLHEKEAPAGYDYAEDIVFTVPIDSKGEVIINNNTAAAVTMVDTPLATLPNTGATSDPWWLFGAVGCGLIFAEQYRRKKEKENKKEEPSAKS